MAQPTTGSGSLSSSTSSLTPFECLTRQWPNSEDTLEWARFCGQSIRPVRQTGSTPVTGYQGASTNDNRRGGQLVRPVAYMPSRANVLSSNEALVRLVRQFDRPPSRLITARPASRPPRQG